MDGNGKNIKQMVLICYIIESKKYPGKIYIGTTNNFDHRLRKHKREIVGRDKHSKRLHPFKPYKFIRGFLTDKLARQFEYAIQQPHRSRYLKKNGSIRKRIATIAEIEVTLQEIQQVKKFRRLFRENTLEIVSEL